MTCGVGGSIPSGRVFYLHPFPEAQMENFGWAMVGVAIGALGCVIGICVVLFATKNSIKKPDDFRSSNYAKWDENIHRWFD